MPERQHETTPEQEEQAREDVTGGAGPPALDRILGLQRSAGNAAVSSMLARQHFTPGVEPTTDQEAIEQAEEFFRAGPYEGTLTPGEGISHGGFDASYDPPGNLLTISMKVGVDF